MAEYADREHYLPIRKADLVDLLAADPRVAAEREPFRQLCRLIGAIWHFEYLGTLDRLKDTYAPFDPDSVTPPLKPPSGDQRTARMDQFFEQFVALMERANYKRLSRNDIDAAIEGGASDWGVNMHVDFDVFERLELFVRGEVKSPRTKRHWLFIWRTEQKKVDAYQRLVLLLKLRKHKRVPDFLDTDDVFIKVFKDVPKLDLEMVLPGTSLQMPIVQKWKMGSTLVGTFGYALYSVGAQLWTGFKVLLGLSVAAVATATNVLWGPVILLAGYGYKQYYSYQVTKQTYAKMLTESLYFQNLDNNLGVLTQTVDEAEEQEVRETVLGYFYLWKYAPPEGWTAAQLDDYIELELEGKLGMKVDFEIGDALEKLEKLHLVTRTGDRYHAVALAQALELLDERWDNYFQYHRG
ncbi:MAG: DUF3754 domain-containing protein [Gemmataceae bacterium]